MFDTPDIDRLKEVATPQRVAESHGVSFKPDGSDRIKGRCPIPSHGPQTGETPPFTVYEGGGWKCYGCTAGGGDGIDLEQAITGADFPTAVRALTERFGFQVNGISDHGSQFRIAEIYPYQDEDGQPLFEVVRFQPKDFRQRRRGEDGKWIWNLNGTRRVLYKLPEVIAAVAADEAVWVVEGEKDADNLIRLGLPATTNPGGALKWREEYSESLRGAKVVILPDNDQPGQQHAEQVARSLAGVSKEIKIIRLPGLPEKGDVSDWIAEREEDGKSPEEIRATLRFLANQEAPWIAESGEGSGAASPFRAYRAYRAASDWPQLGEEAFYGLAGRFTRALEPHTEADPAAILLQFLVAVGNLIGRTVYFTVESDQHFLTEFVALVGDSAKARKGTAAGHVRRLLREIDPEWELSRVVDGLSTGEGLIAAVADRETEEEVDDLTEDDKRLLVLQGELAGTLRVLARQGNILSPVLRNAWDGRPLRTLTKNSPLRATGAHISLIGHITAEELVKHLDATEAANGFGNRFLWALVRRSKTLPEGGMAHRLDFSPFVEEMREVSTFARVKRELRRDEAARALWAEVYGPLSEGKPGLFGSLVARAEAHVMRLAAIYAVLDRSSFITRDHLVAALAVWAYCEQSALYLFGDRLGDTVAERIWTALRDAPGGLTRSQIRGLFSGHEESSRLDQALASLAARGWARCETLRTAGRSKEVWFSAASAKSAESAEGVAEPAVASPPASSGAPNGREEGSLLVAAPPSQSPPTPIVRDDGNEEFLL
ncbi:MAG TPA: CHC2 zinc finger domain-containing protein [Thermoanaerobaculia bacterium]|jgi:hypothetical protein